MQFVQAKLYLLTAETHLGNPHFELTSLCVCKIPSTTFLSTTSVPITAGFIGFGYFLQAACATVSQGWLKKNVVISYVSLLDF